MVIDVLEFVLVAYMISVAFAALIMAICISHLWLHRHDPDYHTVLRMFIRMAPAHIFLGRTGGSTSQSHTAFHPTEAEPRTKREPRFGGAFATL